MRDLLLRVDSMDLRVGQFGENLKTLNGLLSISTSVRRESNFSTRLQQFAMSGTAAHDPTEFHNTIDRFNLDQSLRSSVANNTIPELDELDDALDNDDSYNNRGPNVAQIQPEVILPMPSTSGTSNKTALRTNTTHSTPAPFASRTNTINSTPVVTTAATATTVIPAAIPAAAVVATTVINHATTTSKPPALPTTRVTTPPASGTSNNLPTSIPVASNANEGVPDCRLKVVSRNRPSVRRMINEETMKSYYITPFDIDQTEEDIIEYLRETINVDNSTLKCVKLVPRNKNISELSFVSFKLSVSEDLVTLISDPFYWPEGVEVREFQPKNLNAPSRPVQI